MKAFIVMITGLPGTGKSTLAKALSKAWGALHFNTDQIRAELGLMGQYDPESKERVYQEMLRGAGEALEKEQGVIIDGTFYQDSLRKPFSALAIRYDCPIRWVELRAAEDTIRKRVGSYREYTEADFEVYQKIKGIYQPLNGAYVALWSDQLSVDEMIERVKDFLTLPA